MEAENTRLTKSFLQHLKKNPNEELSSFFYRAAYNDVSADNYNRSVGQINRVTLLPYIDCIWLNTRLSQYSIVRPASVWKTVMHTRTFRSRTWRRC